MVERELNRPGGALLVLASAVVLAHVLAIGSLRNWLAPPDRLQPMAVPLMTRTLTPTATVATAPISPGLPPAPSREFVQPAADAPKPSASAATSSPEPATEAPKESAVASTQGNPTGGLPQQEADALPSAQQGAPSGFEVGISAAPAPPRPMAEATSPPPPAAVAQPQRLASLDDWPQDTRIVYWVEGHFGGSIRGPAEVRWLRQGSQYEASIDISIRRTFLSANLTMTSQGLVTPHELRPAAYAERRAQSAPRVVRVDDLGVRLNDGRVLPRPDGIQDTASQFIALSHRFATGRDALAVGRTVQLWLARPGGVDHWTYDVVAREVLDTAQLGKIEAFHLKPRPLVNSRGNIYADIWFAPSLQFLPVRIRLRVGEDAWLDLKVERIEQR